MAQRRMFSKDVTNSDEFLDMPLSSQALYFHLGINADDDGFVQPKGIMRLVQAKDDDLRVLQAKGFIIEFAKSVIVITHWKLNNQIRKDRKKDTIYQEHLATLGLNTAEIYQRQPNDNQPSTKCPHSIVEDSIGKDSKVKVKNSEETSQKNSVNEILNLFHDTINPTINYGNKTTRKACEFLINKFGFKKVEEVVKYAISVQGQKYAPTITTPYQLKEKLAQLKIYMDNQRNNQNNLEDLCKE